MDPLLPEEELALFNKYLDMATNYFEYGSGGSTVSACMRPGIKLVCTVENDEVWKKKLDEMDVIREAVEKKRLYIRLVKMDIIPNKFGYPGPNSVYDDWIKYSRSVDSVDRTVDFDTYFIDGRFRVACAFNCFKRMNKNSVMIFDDFNNRMKDYGVLLDYFDVIESKGRMAILKKKEGVTHVPLDLVNKFECIPR